MGIIAVQGIAVRCNLCSKSGPITRFDATRYRHIPHQPNHPNEIYIRNINISAEKEALAEGFIALLNPEVEVEPNLDDEEQVPAAPVAPKHICPACLEGLSECIVKKNKLFKK